MITNFLNIENNKNITPQGKDNNFSIFSKENIDENDDIIYSKITNYDEKEEDKENTEAAPSLVFSLYLPEIKYNKDYDIYEIQKLILIKSKFFYNNRINKNDFYKVTYGNNIEIKYQAINQIKEKYDKYNNNYQYNYINLIGYAKEVLNEIKNLNKKKKFFELELSFNNDKFNNEYFSIPEKEKGFQDFNISCEYILSYIDERGKEAIKSIYKHKNMFTANFHISDIILDIEKILEKRCSNIIKIEEEKEVENKINSKNIKINKINYSKIKIISFKKCLANHEDGAQMIKEFPCGKFVSCGLDGKLILYYDNLEKKYEFKIIENWIYSISDIPGNENNFMACCPEKIVLLSIDGNELNLADKSLNIDNTLNKFSFFTRKDEIILCGNNALTHYKGTIEDIKENNNINILNNLHYTCGKAITKNKILVVSNKVLNHNKKGNGEDILKFINTNNGNELNQVEGSFNIGPNSLLIIDKNIDIAPRQNKNLKKSKKNKKNKIYSNQNTVNEKIKLLFCACTKYYDDQKNGIFVIYFTNEKIIHEYFYDTGGFEVFCFCELNYKNDDEQINKNYLLVGGYDNNLNQGLIKLYEIGYYDNNSELPELKFIRNIRGLSKFKQPINCIIQSSKTGEILLTSWDGSVNLFTRPNLENFVLKNNIFNINNNDIINRKESDL